MIYRSLIQSLKSDISKGIKAQESALINCNGDQKFNFGKRIALLEVLQLIQAKEQFIHDNQDAEVVPDHWLLEEKKPGDNERQSYVTQV